MKKLLSLLAVLAMLSLASCGQTDDEQAFEESSELNIDTESVDVELDAIIE